MKTKFYKFFFGGIVALAVISGIVMLLWNWLLPSIFGLPSINFWQAFGLFVLGRLLFGSFGPGHGRFSHKHGHLHQKWAQMTDQERREFVARRHRFGFGRHCCEDTVDGKSKEE